jgi:hypothetical protein
MPAVNLIETGQSCGNFGKEIRVANQTSLPSSIVVCKRVRETSDQGASATRTFQRIVLPGGGNQVVGCTKEGNAVVDYASAWTEATDKYAPTDVAGSAYQVLRITRLGQSPRTAYVFNMHSRKTVNIIWHDKQGNSHPEVVPAHEPVWMGRDFVGISLAEYGLGYTPEGECVRFGEGNGPNATQLKAMMPAANQCPSDRSCCCKSGSYGMCTTKSQCEAIAGGGACVSTPTPGCK